MSNDKPGEIIYVKFKTLVRVGNSDTDEWTSVSHASTSAGTVTVEDKGQRLLLTFTPASRGDVVEDEIPISNVADIRRRRPRPETKAPEGKKS